MNFIVTNKDGLNVRSQMDTTLAKNILRRMGKGEGFEVYETYSIKGKSGLQTWGRLSNNPGSVNQEYSCLSIGNVTYAKVEGSTPPSPTPIPPPEWAYIQWAIEVDHFLREQMGYTGARPL